MAAWRPPAAQKVVDTHRLWAVVAALGAVLGRSWRLVGPSWASPEGFREGILGGPVGGGPRKTRKPFFSATFRCVFLFVLASFLGVVWLPYGAPGGHANLENG